MSYLQLGTLNLYKKSWHSLLSSHCTAIQNESHMVSPRHHPNISQAFQFGLSLHLPISFHHQCILQDLDVHKCITVSNDDSSLTIASNAMFLMTRCWM